MQSARELLKSKKMKATPQRIAILELLMNTKAHPTAYEIYRSFDDTKSDVSIATIYKTLDAFKKSGLILELSFGEEKFRYDADTSTHVHLLCSKCGAVDDASTDKISTSIDVLSQTVAETSGFNISNTQICFHGICKKCSSWL